MLRDLFDSGAPAATMTTKTAVLGAKKPTKKCFGSADTAMPTAPPSV